MSVYTNIFLLILCSLSYEFGDTKMCDSCNDDYPVNTNIIKNIYEFNGKKYVNICTECLATSIICDVKNGKNFNETYDINDNDLKNFFNKKYSFILNSKKINFWKEYNKITREKRIFKNKNKFRCAKCNAICNIKKKKGNVVICKKGHKSCITCKKIIENEEEDHSNCKESAIETMIEYNNKVLEEIDSGKAFNEIDKTKINEHTIYYVCKTDFEEGHWDYIKNNNNLTPTFDFNNHEMLKIDTTNFKYNNIIEEVKSNKKIKIYRKTKTNCKLYTNKGMKICPSCGVAIEKFDGCNQMRCTYCNYYWCWMCGSNCSPEKGNPDSVPHFKCNSKCTHYYDTNSRYDGGYCGIMNKNFKEYRTVKEIMHTAADKKNEEDDFEEDDFEEDDFEEDEDSVEEKICFMHICNLCINYCNECIS